MNHLKIYNAQIINEALKVEDTLVISDLHFGYEASLNKQGLMIPYFQFEKIINRLELIYNKANVDKIILNGDIKHNFGSIDKQEWKEVLSFIDYLQDLFVDIKVIRGNHDNFTQYILNKRDLVLEDYAVVSNYYITHGHKIHQNLPPDVDTVIIGHEHPCIGIRNGERLEKVKSFLKGKWNNYNLIVCPSFTQISYGSDILHEKTISPFIKDIKKFEAYAIEGNDIYNFGLVEDLLSINNEFNEH